MSKLVSIIIPVYNMAKSLERSVKSLLEQDYKEIEIVLVDDGSTDGSYQICEQLTTIDNRIKCIHTENRGSGPARNAGIQTSRGKYLYFPDADDYVEKNAIGILVDAVNDGEFDLVVFGYKNFSSDGNIISKREYAPHEATGENIRKNYSPYFGMENEYSIQGAPWNKFFDHDVIRKNNVEFPPLRREQDECFISRYVSHCKNVRFIPDILYSYYQNDIDLEYKKYPINYLEIVNQINDIWNETICLWNCEDGKTHEMVYKSIFRKKTKVLELSFSPKLKLNIFSRITWLRNSCTECQFTDYDLGVADNPYDKALLLCAKSNLHLLMELIIYIRITKKKRYK